MDDMLTGLSFSTYPTPKQGIYFYNLSIMHEGAGETLWLSANTHSYTHTYTYQGRREWHMRSCCWPTANLEISVKSSGRLCISRAFKMHRKRIGQPRLGDTIYLCRHPFTHHRPTTAPPPKNPNHPTHLSWPVTKLSLKRN